MSDYTAGPWFWDSEGLALRTLTAIHSGERVSEEDADTVLALGSAGIARDVENGHITWEEFAPSEANARLIAAAPDMLEALEMILNNGYRMPRASFQAARAAIAKAKGETP